MSFFKSSPFAFSQAHRVLGLVLFVCREVKVAYEDAVWRTCTESLLNADNLNREAMIVFEFGRFAVHVHFFTLFDRKTGVDASKDFTGGMVSVRWKETEAGLGLEIFSGSFSLSDSIARLAL